MKRLSCIACVALSLSVVVVRAQEAAPSGARLALPPPPPVQPVTEDLFGTTLTDPYRYMENLKDPAVLDWIKAQGAYTRALLDSIPARANYLAKVSALSASYDVATGYQRFGKHEFFEERTPGSDNFDLMVRDIGGAARKLVDLRPLRAEHGGKAYAIDYFQPSPDGTKVAVGVSAGGSEDASLIVYDATTGAPLTRAIDRARQSSPTWSDDGKTLYFSLMQPAAADTPTAETLLNVSEYRWDLKGEPQPIFGHDAPSAPPIPASYFPAMVTWPGAHVAAIDVRTAYDGMAGLELADEFRPNVVLLDIGMPRLNGYDTCKRLRSTAWGRSVTVVATTGWGDAAAKQAVIDAGFDFHLVKPLDEAELARILETV